MKKSSANSRNHFLERVVLSVLFFYLVVGSACYQKEEGCLDIKAVNFDVSADIACEDCCEYPELSIRLDHKAILPDTTLPFRYDSLFYVAAYPDVKFRFHRLRYYLSDIRLVSGNAVGQPTDTLTLYLPQNPGDTVPVQVIDDFILADRDFLQANQLGRWEGDGAFDRLEFTLGVRDDIRYTDPQKVPSGHPLTAPDEGYNWEEGTGYISNFIAYSTENQPLDTLMVPVTTPVPVSLLLDPPLEIIPGYDIELKLFLNYMAWFEDLDLSTASPTSLEQHYVNRASNAFYQIEVLFK